MRVPAAGEYWHVRYGLGNKTSIIVLVLEDIEIKPPFNNWTCYNFKCLYKNDTDGLGFRKMLVSGETFEEFMHDVTTGELEAIKLEHNIVWD